jgi:hypothetical protein
MNRSIWFALCAVFAVLLTRLVATAQDADPFGQPAEGAVENPFEEVNAADVSRAIDRSLIAPAEGQPAQGQMAAATPAADNDFCQCIGEGDSMAVAKIEEALRGQLKSQGLDFTDTSLEEVAGFIQETYNIPVQLDTTALEEEGIDPQEPVNVSLQGISLRSALRLMLKHLNLTYIIQDEVLLITSPSAAESQLVTCVYDVRDLVAGANDVGGPDELIDAIINSISSETWAENGGGEAVVEYLKPGMLVISQTRAVHEEIRALLVTIRNVQKRPMAAAAGDAEKRAATAGESDQLVTRAYVLSLAQPTAPAELQSQVKKLITAALPDEKWEGRLSSGEPVLLTVLPDRVVLRHKASVHEKVESLLGDSGVAAPPATETARRGGFGGAGGGFGGGGGFFRPRPE